MDPLIKLESQGLADRYYQICEEHPLRFDEPIGKMSAREVLEAAEGTIDIATLKGPGRVYEVQDLPDSIYLKFVIQTEVTVEAHLQLDAIAEPHLWSFATICRAAKEASGAEMPDPAYPRPTAHSASELMEVFTKLRQLALEFDRSM